MFDFLKKCLKFFIIKVGKEISKKKLDKYTSIEINDEWNFKKKFDLNKFLIRTCYFCEYKNDPNKTDSFFYNDLGKVTDDELENLLNNSFFLNIILNLNEIKYDMSLMENEEKKILYPIDKIDAKWMIENEFEFLVKDYQVSDMVNQINQKTLKFHNNNLLNDVTYFFLCKKIGQFYMKKKNEIHQVNPYDIFDPKDILKNKIKLGLINRPVLNPLDMAIDFFDKKDSKYINFRDETQHIKNKKNIDIMQKLKSMVSSTTFDAMKKNSLNFKELALYSVYMWNLILNERFIFMFNKQENMLEINDVSNDYDVIYLYYLRNFFLNQII